MTKQEIFDKNKVNNQCGSVLYLPESEKAMDQYAKEQSISFGEWLFIRDYKVHVYDENKGWLWVKPSLNIKEEMELNTTESLYQLFLQQQTSIK